MGDTNGFRIENGKLISYTGDDLEIIIPDEVTEIGSSVFANSGVRKVVIGDSVKIIGFCAFRNCKTLMEVSLTNGLEEIGASAFEGCVGLQKIHIGDSVKAIGSEAFKSCRTLMEVYLSKDLEEISASAFESCASLQKIYGGSKIKRIGDAAFQKCPIAEFDFSSVTSIGAEAFSDCKLTEVTFGRGLAFLGRSAFSGCSNLTSVIFDADSPLETIEEHAFENCSVTNLQLPSHLKKIGERAFHYPDNYRVTRKEIILPDSLKIIEEYAFDDSKFELIIIPYGVTHIGAKSFDEAWKIVLPEVFRAQISNIVGSNTKVIYYQTEEQYERLKEYGFLMDGGDLIKVVRKLSLINFPDFVTRICRGAIVDCGLYSTMIPEDTVIEEGAFNCPTLKYVTVSKQYKKKRKLYFGKYKIKYTFI